MLGCKRLRVDLNIKFKHLQYFFFKHKARDCWEIVKNLERQTQTEINIVISKIS